MNAKVLFVDDDESNLVVCAAACKDHFQVRTALNADAALECLRKEEIGVIVADQRMPRITGVELLERVREEYPDTVRLLITAYSDMSAAIDAINRGHVRRYLKKPWLPDELRTEVRDALDVYTMKRSISALHGRLQETERVYALGVVAASIGHEIRNPISWITNNLSFVRSELRQLGSHLGTDAYRERVEELDSSLHDAAAGVERLLEIVRGLELPCRSNPVQRELVDVAEVVKLSLRVVSAELRRCAALEVDVAGLPKVRASSTKLGQVILNLIVNAIQAVSHRPRNQNTVCVRLFVDEGCAVVQVADNGPGIREQERDRIFEPFHTTKLGTGTGLGLAISRKIVQELSGTLDVTCDERLGGACFSVRLPLPQS